ncbi:MAG TPA: sigma-70 family RNA polymerase sigma factor [Gemmatimonadales bacterium]|nr:sigma-70 family RNA polymerase sigma factor [Gemmatimonadales bacterium]
MQDAELAALAHAGNREAFGELVSRYVAQSRRVARAVLRDSADADDAVQDAFLSALKNLGRYDPARPFGPWLLRIVANAATDRLRRRRVRAGEPIGPHLAADEPGPDRLADRSALGEALWAALATLPERQRMAVVLFDVEGYSHREIAEALGVPEGTVRSHVFHARRALRDALAAWRP